MSNVKNEPYVKITITIESEDAMPKVEIEPDIVIVSWRILGRIFKALRRMRKEQIRRRLTNDRTGQR